MHTMHPRAYCICVNLESCSMCCCRLLHGPSSRMVFPCNFHDQLKSAGTCTNPWCNKVQSLAKKKWRIRAGYKASAKRTMGKIDDIMLHTGSSGWSMLVLLKLALHVYRRSWKPSESWMLTLLNWLTMKVPLLLTYTNAEQTKSYRKSIR